MNEKFQKAVELKHTKLVRIFLSNQLLLDPRGDSYNDMKRYAEGNILDLYEQDNDQPFSKSTSCWDQNFLNATKNSLDSNFSKKKLAYYEEVVKVVLKEKADEMRRKADKETAQGGIGRGGYTGNNSARQEQGKTYNSNTKKNNQTGMYLGVGGAIILIAGICLEKTIITSIGVVAIVASGLYLITKKE